MHAKTMDIRHMLALGMLLVAALLASGCNTVEGAGEDLETASEEVQEEM